MTIPKAEDALSEMTGTTGWSFVPPIIDIYDAAGPLLFQDYCFERGGKAAWTRLMPSVGDRLVSIEYGLHPARRARATNGGLPAFLYDRLPHEETLFLSRLHTRIRESFPDVQIESLAAGRIYCYHYPNIGTLSQSLDGKPEFRDLVDGREFSLTESGQSSSEDRQSYSFLGVSTEGGDPGPIVAPAPSETIPGGHLLGQQHDNWCAAASCQMLLRFHNIDHAQPEIAQAMGIPADPNTGGADLDAQLQAYRHFAPALTIVKDDSPQGQACIDELAGGRPLKIGIFKHAQACFGWSTIGGDVLYQIYDPMPISQGQTKLQNPAVIWSQNHIYLR